MTTSTQTRLAWAIILSQISLTVAGMWAQAPAAAGEERPVALVLTAAGTSLVRAGSDAPLAAHAGDIIFPGDTVETTRSGSISFLFCPEKVRETLGSRGFAKFEAAKVSVEDGELADKAPVPTCVLPQMGRMGPASELHTGASATRALQPEGQALPGTFATRLAALPEDKRTALQAELAPIDQALAADANNVAQHIARAEALAKYGMAADAAEEYSSLQKTLPDSGWLKARMFVLEEEAVKTAPAAGGGAAPAASNEPGQTYALLVGISKYQSPAIRPLNFADQDAVLMETYLKSERGGKLPDENLLLLSNEQATTAAIRNAFNTALKARAGKNDTVILLIATHGTVIESKGERGAFIVSYDTDPQDLASTALPMADVQKLIQEDLRNVGRVMAFVDVCRSGTIGTIPTNAKVNNVVEHLAEAEGQMFLFTASRANEYSFEGPQYGGGHGAFTFFMLDALNGSGDLNNDGEISINELIEYTQTRVVEGTADRQHPRENGNYTGTRGLANVKLPGIAMAKFQPATNQADRSILVTANRSLEPVQQISNRPRAAVLRQAVDFQEALDSGRILPDAQRNAFTALRQERRNLKPDQYLVLANELQSALEDRGQQVLLRYLKGDQVPQTREDFAAGAAFEGAARLLAPESVLLEARESFFLGRMRIFDKDYQAASQYLERAARLDPTGAYSWNALGISALEQANFDLAVNYFREANRLAPYWAYPLHNLALTYTQMGNYEDAIRTYRDAMRLAPSYSYLPYNLGLVYQRLNRGREAEAAFRQAQALAPDDPMPLNALGFVNAEAGRRRQAEDYYRQALAKNPDMVEARHNLAVLLAERPQTVEQAITLWRENLAKSPNHLPSSIGLAKALDSLDRRPEAIAEYRAILMAKPGYAAAQIALGGLLDRDGKPAEALVAWREAVKLQPRNGDAWEKVGDHEKAAGNAAQAAEAYRQALEYSTDGSSKKRIRKKM